VVRAVGTAGNVRSGVRWSYGAVLLRATTKTWPKYYDGAIF